MADEYVSNRAWLANNHEGVLNALDVLNDLYGVGYIYNYGTAPQFIGWEGVNGVVGRRGFKVHHLKNGGASIELCGHRRRILNPVN